MKTAFFLGLFGIVSCLLCPSFALGEGVEIGVRVILASHQSQDIDTQLEDIQKNLDTLNYSSYRLLQEHTFLLTKGEVGQIPLTGNKELRIQLLQEQGGTAEIAVEILRAGFNKTTAKLKKGGTLLIGGPKHEDGVLILAISAQ